MPSDHRPGLVEVGHATVPCGPLAPSLARTVVARWLDSRGDAELVRDACLLLSELVTNSTRHAGQAAGAPVQIRASAVDGVVRIEVEDRGDGAVGRRAPDPLSGGFGLNFVDTSLQAGESFTSTGTLVWFELAAGRSGT